MFKTNLENLVGDIPEDLFKKIKTESEDFETALNEGMNGFSELLQKDIFKIIKSQINPIVDYPNLNPTYVKIALAISKPVHEDVIDINSILNSNDSSKKLISDIKRNKNYKHYSKKLKSSEELKAYMFDMFDNKDSKKNIVEILDECFDVIPTYDEDGQLEGVGFKTSQVQPKYIFEYVICLLNFKFRFTDMLTYYSMYINTANPKHIKTFFKLYHQNVTDDCSYVERYILVQLMIMFNLNFKIIHEAQIISMFGLMLQLLSKIVPLSSIESSKIYEEFRKQYYNNEKMFLDIKQRTSNVNDKINKLTEEIEEEKKLVRKSINENINLNNENIKLKQKLSMLENKAEDFSDKDLKIQFEQLQEEYDRAMESISQLQVSNSESAKREKDLKDKILSMSKNTKISDQVLFSKIKETFNGKDSKSQAKYLNGLSDIFMSNELMLDKLNEMVSEKTYELNNDRHIGYLNYNFDDKKLEVILANDRKIEVKDFLPDNNISKNIILQNQFVVVTDNGLVIYVFKNIKSEETSRYYGSNNKFGLVTIENGNKFVQYGSQKKYKVSKTGRIDVSHDNIYTLDSKNAIVNYNPILPRILLNNIEEWLNYNNYKPYLVMKKIDGQGVLVRDIFADDETFININPNYMQSIIEPSILILDDKNNVKRSFADTTIYTNSSIYDRVKIGVVQNIFDDQDMFVKFENGEIKIIDATGSIEFKDGDIIKVDEFDNFIDFCNDASLLQKYNKQPVYKKQRMRRFSTNEIKMKDEIITVIGRTQFLDSYKWRFLKEGYRCITVDGDASLSDVKRASKNSDIIVMNTASSSHTLYYALKDEYGTDKNSKLLLMHTISPREIVDATVKKLTELKVN